VCEEGQEPNQDRVGLAEHTLAALAGAFMPAVDARHDMYFGKCILEVGESECRDEIEMPGMDPSGGTRLTLASNLGM
jgi:hypothetical protein